MDYDGDLEIECICDSNDKLSIEAGEDYELLISVCEEGAVSMLYIDKEKAIQLRDWLNEFLRH